MSTALKAHHDRLMEIKPEDASHDASACLFCTDVEVASASTTEGGSVEDKTYTEDEHSAVLAQVADLEAKVAELTKAAEGSELDAKVAEVKAEMETQLADLQAKLDTAVLEAGAEAGGGRNPLVQAREFYGLGGAGEFAPGAFAEY